MRKKESHVFPWLMDPIFHPPDLTMTVPDPQDDTERVTQAWYEVVGPHTSQNARPLSFGRGVLCLRVRNPIWMQELSMHRSRLIQDINRAVGRNVVRELRMELGLLPSAPPHVEQEAQTPTWQKRELPPELLDEIEEKLAHLPENDLKQAARRIMTQQYKLNLFQDS